MSKINVLVVGLPGNMASGVATEITKQPDMNLITKALTGPGILAPSTTIEGIEIQLFQPPDHRNILEEVKRDFPDMIAVDFAAPKIKTSEEKESINNLVRLYAELSIPSVIGATGRDENVMRELIENSETCAVIAPNMGKQIVAFQAMMEYAANTFPDVFKGYTLEIKESHQKSKVDTSGTAKAMVKYFNKLGIPFTPEQIVMIRDPAEQLKLGVPEEYLNGHGWHTYTLRSPDRTVLFQFTHNVNGRMIYRFGALDAIRYLHKKVNEGCKGVVYTMIDVLRG
jgi:4-hydroxy-tetrahydrodipicolinate reductase